MRAIWVIFKRLLFRSFFIQTTMKSSHVTNTLKEETWSVSNTQKQMAFSWPPTTSRQRTQKSLSENIKASTKRKVTLLTLSGRLKEKQIQISARPVLGRRVRNKFLNIDWDILELVGCCLIRKKLFRERLYRYLFWGLIWKILWEKRRLFITRFFTLFQPKYKLIIIWPIKNVTSLN